MIGVHGMQDAMLREFQEEISRLEAELAAGASQLHTPAQAQEQRIERIVERALSPEEVLAMRAQMEQEMQAEAVQHGEPLDADTLAKVFHAAMCCLKQSQKEAWINRELRLNHP